MNQQQKEDETSWQEHVRAAQEESERVLKRAKEVSSTKFIVNQIFKVPITIALTVLVLGLAWAGDTYLIPFSPQDWNTAGQLGADSDKRNRMLRRLEHQHQLTGISRVKLVELVGEPDAIRPKWDMAYSLGSDGFMEDEFLVFRLKRGNVIAYSVVTSS